MEKFIFQWSESESLVLVNCWAETFCQAGQIVGSDLDVFGVVENRVATTFIAEENAKASDSFSSKNFIEPSFQQTFLKRIENAKKKFDAFFSEVQATNISKLTNAELAGLLDRFSFHVIQSMIPFIMMQAEFTDYPYSMLNEVVKKTGAKDVAADVGLLITPDKLDIIKREELAFSKLSKKATDSVLMAHASKYAFLFYNTYDVTQVVQFLKSRLADVKPYDALKEKFEAELSKRKKLQGELEAKLDTKALQIALFLRELAWERLELKDKWAGAEFRFLPLFKETAKRAQVSLREVFSIYSIPELIALLRKQNTIPSSELAHRKKFYVLTARGGKLAFYSGEEAQRLTKQLVPHYFNAIDSLEIKGAVANPGKVSGIARVVKVVGIEELVKNMELFKDGEILVTTMTQPNMVPIVKKAKAMVTDEGGMTSHAAVIAREFSLPCIVGTHVGTKLIKTGDLIEVDANNGVVRKL